MSLVKQQEAEEMNVLRGEENSLKEYLPAPTYDLFHKEIASTDSFKKYGRQRYIERIKKSHGALINKCWSISMFFHSLI